MTVSFSRTRVMEMGSGVSRVPRLREDGIKRRHRWVVTGAVVPGDSVTGHTTIP